MRNDKYLQFPLCALALDIEARSLMQLVMSYGMIEAGRSVIADMEAEEREEKCEEFDLDAAMSDSFELCAHLGAQVCGMTVGSARNSVCRHSTIYNHAAKWDATHGPGPLVRIRTDECFEVRDGGQMSFREFRVLAAIFSAIGSKSIPVVIPQRMIAARYIGCKSEAVKAAALKARHKFPAELTPKQLRGTVEKLHELKWFARVTPDPHGRVTYFSHRMSEDDMRDRIFVKRTYSPAFKADRQKKNAALAIRIKEANGTFNSSDEKMAPSGHREGDDAAPSGQQEGQQEGHREGTFNINPLNRNPLNRNSENINPLDKNPLKYGALASPVVVDQKNGETVATPHEPTPALWVTWWNTVQPAGNGIPVAPWRSCSSQHAAFHKWDSELTEF